MKTRHPSWVVNARIIRAITAKDILEALKNKNAITVLISSLFIVVAYRFIPILESSAAPPIVLVYDAGNSTLVASLEESPNLAVYSGYTSEEIMKFKLSEGDVPEMGLVIPAGFDQAMAEGKPPVLQGYVVAWVTPQEAAVLQETVATELTRLAGQTIQLQVEGNIVPLTPESGGIGNWAGLSIVFTVLMIGVTMIPHLMLEEKQTRTLEALLVSPAGPGHIAIAKALTGLFYTLLGAGVGLVIYHRLVEHWWLAILAVLCGALSSVALGLLIGTKIENRGQLTLWSWVLLVPLFVGVFLSMMTDLIPEALIRIFQALPTTMLFNLLRTSFAGEFPIGKTLLGFAWIAAWAGGFLLGMAWLVNRRDRQAEAPVERSDEEDVEKISPPVLVAPLSIEEGTRTRSRPVWAIFSKDILEAIKNKIFLSILLGQAFLVLSHAALYWTLESRASPVLVIYDQGQSAVAQALAADGEERIFLVNSQADFESAISGSSVTLLGLIIPADMDARLARGETVVLQAYQPHWAKAEKIRQWATHFEQVLEQVVAVETSGAAVRVLLPGTPLYPSDEAGGQLGMSSLLLAITPLVTAASLTPLLLVEEKEAHTLQALLVSPASLAQVVTGKALVGILYGLVASAVVLLIYHSFVVHWGIALLAALLTTVFAVAAGLLIGGLSDNPSTTGVWGGFIVFLVVIPMVLEKLAGNSLSPAVQTVLSWLPGSQILKLFQNALAGQAVVAQVSASAYALVGISALLFLLVGWTLRRMN